jgi:hypothetical protein
MIDLMCVALGGVGFSIMNSIMNGVIIEPTVEAPIPTISVASSNTSAGNIASSPAYVFYKLPKPQISIFIKFNDRNWEFYDDDLDFDNADKLIECKLIIPSIVVNSLVNIKNKAKKI